jgi:glutamate carboxypeptidase
MVSRQKLASSPRSFDPAPLLPLAAAAEPALLRLLQQLVEIESPSHDRAAVNRCVDAVAEAGARLGGRPRRYRHRSYGDVLELRFATRKPGRPLLLLGHLDTVWPMGTLTTMPFRLSADRVAGPGVFDMKAGVAMALTAIEILQTAALLDRPVTLLLVSDEEIGSPFSRPITERIAREASAVFVLEPAQGPAGAYKTARKGVDFESGHSAIHELAYQIEQIRAFTELDRGLTVNVGVIRGGSARNVIAAHAEADIDVRIARAADAARIARKFEKLRPRDRSCVLSVEGCINRPPMERTPGTVALFRQAETLARKLGFALAEASTGGGSDGNFTSALGVPTLDGMGAVGEGAHASQEAIARKDIIPRTALLAAMVASAER